MAAALHNNISSESAYDLSNGVDPRLWRLVFVEGYRCFGAKPKAKCQAWLLWRFDHHDAFAKPEIYEALEERGVKYAIRIPSNDNLERDIAELVPRPAGRPSKKPLVEYKGFLYQAGCILTSVEGPKN